MVRELVKRDFVGRYAGSLLGLFWSFAQPLWMLILFGFVFGTVLKVSLVGESTQSFGVFVFCGLLPWTGVHESLLRSTTAVTDNANLVKKLRFPSQILVFTVVVSALLHQMIGLVLFVAFLSARGELSWTGLPWLLAAIPLQVALTAGLGLALATLHVYFRDTIQVLALVLSGWFYLTPIVYPLRLVPESVRAIIVWNPLTTLVSLYRRAMVGSDEPLGPAIWVFSVVAVIALLFGLWFFQRLRSGFADEV